MSRTRSWNWLFLLHLGIAAWLLAASASAQGDALSEMPSVAKVRASVRGSDPFDTAVRQSGAFQFLRDVVTDLSDGRDVTNRLTPQERTLMSGYLRASMAASTTAEALLTKRGAPRTGADSPKPTTFRASEHYHYNAAFQRELLQTLFSQQFVANYDAVKSARQARAQRPVAGSRASAGSNNGPPRDAGEWLDRGATLLTSALGPIGTLLALGAASLLGLTYPLLAFLRSRRVEFWAATGPVTGSKTWSSQDTHHSPGYTDAQGVYRPGSSYTTSSRNDEFFIQEGQRTHTVTLRNVHLAVDRGHSVTVVWIGATKKARSWWVARVCNHNTGQAATLPGSCRRVRGSSLTTSSWWTFLLFTPACALAYFYAGGGETGGMLVGMLSSVAFGYWFWGGFAMKLVHVFGDRSILARSKRYENPGIT